MELLIELSISEIILPGLPSLTHIKLVNFVYELSRSCNEKLGYINCWFAKGIIVNIDGISKFYEFPGIAGINIIFEDNYVNMLHTLTSNPNENPETNILRHIYNFVLEGGYVDGYIVEL